MYVFKVTEVHFKLLLGDVMVKIAVNNIKLIS